MRKTTILIITLIISFSTPIHSKDYIIFNISQQIPMGYKNENPKKNFFVNIGKIQGVKVGTVLDVHRKVSKLNPLKTWKRHRFDIKVGQLEVIHSEDYSAICKRVANKSDKNGDHSLEIESFLLGDIVSVNIEKN
ncbi:MAG: hypothetical protein CME68_11400 [Halobacteriovoraceae bacterium]|nr:hypothetical protein [Halobacteriovoraceae bacterium]